MIIRTLFILLETPRRYVYIYVHFYFINLDITPKHSLSTYVFYPNRTPVYGCSHYPSYETRNPYIVLPSSLNSQNVMWFWVPSPIVLGINHCCTVRAFFVYVKETSPCVKIKIGGLKNIIQICLYSSVIF